MIHSHYLTGVFPALLLLMACALEAGWRTGPRALAILPAIVLAGVTVASLVRMYTVPHKTDWRGVADLIGGHGGELPVYFYEDIGADPFRYYRPDQPQWLVQEPFGADGWQKTRTEMEKERDGFWVVVYPVARSTQAEVARIGPWLEEHFHVEETAAFPPIPVLRVWRCRP
jgi:hypothetical protein